MSILTDSDILKSIREGSIVIDPFDPHCLGTNSYDVHLSKHIKIYKDLILDAKRPTMAEEIVIPDVGIMLTPGRIFLASTLEYTETHNAVPFLEGKSSIGRLGINIHATAGKGDVGFCNHWTMELSCIQPVIIYPGMPIAQLIYHDIVSTPIVSYRMKHSAKYRDRDEKPQETRMWKNFL